MFQGLTIDELINSVERAEQNARQQREKTAAEIKAQQYPLNPIAWRQVTGVA